MVVCSSLLPFSYPLTLHKDLADTYFHDSEMQAERGYRYEAADFIKNEHTRLPPRLSSPFSPLPLDFRISLQSLTSSSSRIDLRAEKANAKVSFHLLFGPLLQPFQKERDRVMKEKRAGDFDSRSNSSSTEVPNVPRSVPRSRTTLP